MKPQIEMIPGEILWEEHEDEDGHRYYWNVTTGVCQWEKPNDIAPELIKHIDDRAESTERQQHLEKLFRGYDIDGSGFISADELRTALDDMQKQKAFSIRGKVFTLSEQDVADVLKLADKNKDGKVDITEATLITHKRVEEWYENQYEPRKKMKSALKKLKLMGLTKIKSIEPSVSFVWEEHEDEDGHRYYWNVTTGVCQWEKPNDIAPELIKHIDDRAESTERQQHLEKLFRGYDIDGSGFISADELRTALDDMQKQKAFSIRGKVFTLSEQDVADVLKLADKNKDGKVDITEATLITHKRVEEWYENQYEPRKKMKSALKKLKLMGLKKEKKVAKAPSSVTLASSRDPLLEHIEESNTNNESGIRKITRAKGERKAIFWANQVAALSVREHFLKLHISDAKDKQAAEEEHLKAVLLKSVTVANAAAHSAHVAEIDSHEIFTIVKKEKDSSKSIAAETAAAKHQSKVSSITHHEKLESLWRKSATSVCETHTIESNRRIDQLERTFERILKTTKNCTQELEEKRAKKETKSRAHNILEMKLTKNSAKAAAVVSIAAAEAARAIAVTAQHICDHMRDADEERKHFEADEKIRIDHEKSLDLEAKQRIEMEKNALLVERKEVEWSIRRRKQQEKFSSAAAAAIEAEAFLSVLIKKGVKISSKVKQKASSKAASAIAAAAAECASAAVHLAEQSVANAQSRAKLNVEEQSKNETNRKLLEQEKSTRSFQNHLTKCVTKAARPLCEKAKALSKDRRDLGPIVKDLAFAILATVGPFLSHVKHDEMEDAKSNGEEATKMWKNISATAQKAETIFLKRRHRRRVRAVRIILDKLKPHLGNKYVAKGTSKQANRVLSDLKKCLENFVNEAEQLINIESSQENMVKGLQAFKVESRRKRTNRKKSPTHKERTRGFEVGDIALHQSKQGFLSRVHVVAAKKDRIGSYFTVRFPDGIEKLVLEDSLEHTDPPIAVSIVLERFQSTENEDLERNPFIIVKLLDLERAKERGIDYRANGFENVDFDDAREIYKTSVKYSNGKSFAWLDEDIIVYFNTLHSTNSDEIITFEIYDDKSGDLLGWTAFQPLRHDGEIAQIKKTNEKVFQKLFLYRTQFPSTSNLVNPNIDSGTGHLQLSLRLLSKSRVQRLLATQKAEMGRKQRRLVQKNRSPKGRRTEKKISSSKGKDDNMEERARVRKERRIAREQRRRERKVGVDATSNNALKDDEWVPYVDEVSGMVYYHSQMLDKSIWGPPAEWFLATKRPMSRQRFAEEIISRKSKPAPPLLPDSSMIRKGSRSNSSLVNLSVDNKRALSSHSNRSIESVKNSSSLSSLEKIARIRALSRGREELGDNEIEKQMRRDVRRELIRAKSARTLEVERLVESANELVEWSPDMQTFNRPKSSLRALPLFETGSGSDDGDENVENERHSDEGYTRNRETIRSKERAKKNAHRSKFPEIKKSSAMNRRHHGGKKVQALKRNRRRRRENNLRDKHEISVLVDKLAGSGLSEEERCDTMKRLSYLRDAQRQRKFDILREKQALVQMPEISRRMNKKRQGVRKQNRNRQRAKRRFRSNQDGPNGNYKDEKRQIAHMLVSEDMDNLYEDKLWPAGHRKRSPRKGRSPRLKRRRGQKPAYYRDYYKRVDDRGTILLDDAYADLVPRKNENELRELAQEKQKGVQEMLHAKASKRSLQRREQERKQRRAKEERNPFLRKIRRARMHALGRGDELSSSSGEEEVEHDDFRNVLSRRQRELRQKNLEESHRVKARQLKLKKRLRALTAKSFKDVQFDLDGRIVDSHAQELRNLRAGTSGGHHLADSGHNMNAEQLVDLFKQVLKSNDIGPNRLHNIVGKKQYLGFSDLGKALANVVPTAAPSLSATRHLFMLNFGSKSRLVAWKNLRDLFFPLYGAGQFALPQFPESPRATTGKAARISQIKQDMKKNFVSPEQFYRILIGEKTSRLKEYWSFSEIRKALAQAGVVKSLVSCRDMLEGLASGGSHSDRVSWKSMEKAFFDVEVSNDK
eukprot:g1842.t1